MSTFNQSFIIFECDKCSKKNLNGGVAKNCNGCLIKFYDPIFNYRFEIKEKIFGGTFQSSIKFNFIYLMTLQK